MTSINADKFDEWKKDEFEPEEFFIEMLEVIDGVTDIETQTYKVRLCSYQGNLKLCTIKNSGVMIFSYELY